MKKKLSLDEIAARIADQPGEEWSSIEKMIDPAEDPLVVEALRDVFEMSRPAGRQEDTPSGRAPALESSPPRPPEMWGNLKLIEILGEGSQGTVYRALDTNLEREVALKLTHENHVWMSSGTGSQRGFREARLLAKVRHPNVVMVHGVERREGWIGLWMDLVKGATLETILETSGPMSALEAVQVGVDVARALRAIHTHGLIHMDLKCENVMREVGGRIVLMDFGLVQNPASRSTNAGLKGTPLYVAPELLQGGAPGAASDIYALGVLLFRLVTCRFPVEAASVRELFESHRSSQQQSLWDLRPELPAAYVEIVAKALDPDPRRRYKSVGEIAQQLSRVPRLDSFIGEGHGMRASSGGSVGPHEVAVHRDEPPGARDDVSYADLSEDASKLAPLLELLRTSQPSSKESVAVRSRDSNAEGSGSSEFSEVASHTIDDELVDLVYRQFCACLEAMASRGLGKAARVLPSTVGRAVLERLRGHATQEEDRRRLMAAARRAVARAVCENREMLHTSRVFALLDLAETLGNEFSSHRLILEYRLLLGSSLPEVAEQLGAPQAKVERQWRFVRACLFDASYGAATLH